MVLVSGVILMPLKNLPMTLLTHNLKPQAIVHATGSGGTQAGLMLGCHLHGIDSPVKAYAVCDNSAYFADKISADLKDWQERYPSDIDIQHA